MLDASVLTQLTDHFGRLTQPVHLTLALEEGSQPLRELAQALCSTSAQLSWSEGPVPGGRIPSMGVAPLGAPIRVVFAGLPMGHEFTSLVLAVLHAGGHPSKLTQDLLTQVQGLEGEHHFETYFSLTCQNCPDVVQALNLMSVLNPRITHTAIEGGAFATEVADRQILSVPTVYRNGALFGQGRMGVSEIVGRLDAHHAQRQAQALTAQAPFDVLVVGGGPAGVAAAVYAARKGLRTGVVAERIGGQVLDTAAIENFISVVHTEGTQLGAALEAHLTHYGVHILAPHRVEALVPASEGGLHTLRLTHGGQLSSRTVVLAPGARWRHLGVPGEAAYRNQGVAYCPHCDGPLFRGQRVAVVGGGNSGVEAAIDLAGLAQEVVVLEFDERLRADAVLQAALHQRPNIRVVTQAQTTAIEGNGQRVTGLTYRDRADGQTHRLDLEGVFVQIGLLPNTEWLEETVVRTAHGEIVVDERGQTNVPGVFAAGDATTVPFKQIVIAMGEGSKAALGAFDHWVRAGTAQAP